MENDLNWFSSENLLVLSGAEAGLTEDENLLRTKLIADEAVLLNKRHVVSVGKYEYDNGLMVSEPSLIVDYDIRLIDLAREANQESIMRKNSAGLSIVSLKDNSQINLGSSIEWKAFEDENEFINDSWGRGGSTYIPAWKLAFKSA